MLCLKIWLNAISFGESASKTFDPLIKQKACIPNLQSVHAWAQSLLLYLETSEFKTAMEESQLL